MSRGNNVEEIVDNVLSQYSAEEAALAEQVKNLQLKKLNLHQIEAHQLFLPLRYETQEDAIKTKEIALKRNKILLRDLNIAMGKLRSKLCYNPAEDNLNKMIEKYSEILSRPDLD